MMWPLVPNWSSAVKESLAFKTEVLVSRDGTEQRRALRTTPRRSFSFSALADHDRMRTLSAFLAGSPLATKMPEVTRGVRSTTALPSGGNSITVRSVPEWLVPGAAVGLASRRRVREFEVDTVVGDVVQFTSAADLAMASGALLSPLVEGWMSDSVQASMRTGMIGTVDVDFDVAPATEAVDEGEIDYVNWYEGREIFMARPNWARPATAQFQHDVETVDYGRGRVARFLPVDFGTRVFQAAYLNRSADDVQYVRQFFARMKGQRGEFHLPSWEDDLPLKERAEVGTSTITIAGSEVFAAYADDPVHRTILITTKIGRYFPRSIESIALSGGDSVVTLSTPWAFDLDPQEVVTISWMPVCRFASDSLTIEWITDQVAQTTLGFKTLPASADEGGASELDALSAYMLSTYGEYFTEYVLCDPLEWAVNVRYPDIAGI